MAGLAPGRVELLYETDHTRVTRLALAGRTVIRKEPLGPDADARLRHEVAILERLRGVAGRRAARARADVRGLDRAGGRRPRDAWPSSRHRSTSTS